MLRRTALLLEGTAGGLGLLGLVGDLSGVEALASWIPGGPAMARGTALALVATALGMGLRHGPKTSPWQRVCAMAFGAYVCMFSLCVAGQYLFAPATPADWSVGWRWFALLSPALPSPLTGLALGALGAGVMLFDVELKRRRAPREWLGLIAIFVAFVSLVGQAYGAGPRYRLEQSQVVSVALPTGLGLIALGVAMLLERPEFGLVKLFTSGGPGGTILRRLGLAAVLGGPALGALVLAAVNLLHLLDLPLILAFSNVLAVLCALWLLVATAGPLERAHRAVEDHRGRLASLFEHAPEGIFLADIAGRYTEVNAAGCRLLGVSREEILGKSITDIIAPEDEPRLWRSRETLLAGLVDVGEWSLRRKDGSWVPTEVTAKILPDGRWQAFVRDVTERRDLESKLLESRNFLQSVLESATEYAIIAEDLERRIVLWNEGARRVYGHGSDICGQSSDVLVGPEDRAAWAELHAAGLELGTAEGVVHAKRSDGSRFFANVVCTRRLHQGGEPAGVLVVASDLSEQRRQLAEQQFLARVGIELAACLEKREVLQRVSELATSFLGDACAIFAPSEKGFTRVQTHHRDPRKAALMAQSPPPSGAIAAPHPLWTVIEEKRPMLLETLSGDALDDVALSSDHRRLLEQLGLQSMMMVPLLARGQLLAVLCVGSCTREGRFDARHLRLAEELARRAGLALDNVQLYQQSRLEAAVATNLAEGLVLVRADDGTIVYANPRFEAMFGYAPHELVGKPVHTLNANTERGAVEQADGIVAQLSRTGEWHGEIKNVRKDGSEFWCAASVCAFEREQDRVWIAVHMDITDRKILEERNAQALRDKEILLKEIHHRVKNNLQVVSSLFSLQRERTSSDELKRLLDESRTRVQSIALVHEQLYRSADLAAIDFNDYLHDLLRTIRSSYGAELVQVEASASGVVLDVEQAVPCALLICELVSNALKHAFVDGKGKVSVAACRDREGRCVLEVADDGRGVPADLDWTSARTLGLRLVRGLVHQLRGHVELDRTQGTRFRVTFAPSQVFSLKDSVKVARSA